MRQDEPYPEFPDASASSTMEEAGMPRRAARSRAAPAGLARASLILGVLGVVDGLVFMLHWLNRAAITGTSKEIPGWYFGLALGQGISWYVLGLLALIFGIVSLSLMAKQRAGRQRMTEALAGLVLGVAHVAFTAIGFFALLSAFVSNG